MHAGQSHQSYACAPYQPFQGQPSNRLPATIHLRPQLGPTSLLGSSSFNSFPPTDAGPSSSLLFPASATTYSCSPSSFSVSSRHHCFSCSVSPSHSSSTCHGKLTFLYSTDSSQPSLEEKLFQRLQDIVDASISQTSQSHQLSPSGGELPTSSPAVPNISL